MDDDRIERLLSGYRLPQVSPELDQRVLREGAAIAGRAHARTTIEDLGRSLLHGLGFGYLTWLFDWLTTTDAEYRVDFI